MLSAPKSATGPYPHPGTLIYLAEFSDRNHEIRVLNEHCARSPRQFTLPVTARGGAHRLFGNS